MRALIPTLAAAAASMSLAGCVPQSTARPEAPGCPGAEVAAGGPNTLATLRAPQSGRAWTLGRQFDHVLIIVLENQDYDAVVARDYFAKELPRHGTVLTHFVGNFHPSYPNYLAMVGGDYFGSDGDTQLELPLEVRTVAHLRRAGTLDWAQYAEGYRPGPEGACNLKRGALLQDDHYVRRHVPFLSFRSITGDPESCRRILPAGEFSPRRLPAYAFYSPDLCDDAHGDFLRPCTGQRDKLAMAEAWLRGFLQPILDDPQAMAGTLVVLTFDESDDQRHNHIYTALLGPMVARGFQRDDRCYDHYNVLRTIEDNFAIGTLGRQDGASDPIVEVFAGRGPGQ